MRMTMGIYEERVRSILHEELGIRKLCARQWNQLGTLEDAFLDIDYSDGTLEPPFSGHPTREHLSTKDSFHLQNYHFYYLATLRVVDSQMAFGDFPDCISCSQNPVIFNEC
ncbi:hypothetical protein LAZ67_2007004 [Cordylochernes scorpioides]|uniref:Uncharacterized protein n=1 Tax=Cordylochernes scorpioides TaxID=51811 RepID=A0ABY6K5T2_9ARAC|nr:hypothetical protein LAZ67_2007004 [Cordylochernes scorpioides]